MTHGRDLLREEVRRIWEIDRSEVVDWVYRLVNGALVLEREHHDVRGWPPGEAEKYRPILEACHDRGGWLHGLFDGGKLVGVAVLDSRFIGAGKDQLQLKFMHVSKPYRGRGLARGLFELATAEARRRGAKRLYISATPSQRTIDFYLRQGCTVTRDSVSRSCWSIP